jgi:hypothetical protein
MKSHSKEKSLVAIETKLKKTKILLHFKNGSEKIIEVGDIVRGIRNEIGERPTDFKIVEYGDENIDEVKEWLLNSFRYIFGINSEVFRKIKLLPKEKL